MINHCEISFQVVLFAYKYNEIVFGSLRSSDTIMIWVGAPSLATFLLIHPFAPMKNVQMSIYVAGP